MVVDQEGAGETVGGGQGAVRATARRRSVTPRRPPGPKFRLAGGFTAMRRDSLGFLLRTARTYGDVAWFRVGPFDIYLLSHPDHVRELLAAHPGSMMKSQVLQEAKRVLGEGLLTSEGDAHRRNRRIIQPVFHHQRIHRYGRPMVERAERHAGRWRAGQAMDIHQEMMDLTLDIVGATLFGTDIEDAAARHVADALRVMLDMYNRFLLPFARYVERLPLPSNRRFWAAKRSLDDVVYAMIQHRRASPNGGDLLSMLLAARDEDAGGHAMSDQQVRDEATTIFLAGHETTALALTWTWYLLSLHPDVEATMHREVDEAVGDRRPSVLDLPLLPYTRMVLTEGMRLYPPAWAMGRRLLEEVEIGGYVIPARTTAIVSQYIVHHDARWYPDPWRFDPDRWRPESVASRPKHSYFPFGAGPRICVGEDFAWMEGILVLATIARHWSLRLVPGHPIALQPRITLRPRDGIAMTAEWRG
jgi:cytochrome P450